MANEKTTAPETHDYDQTHSGSSETPEPITNEESRYPYLSLTGTTRETILEELGVDSYTQLETDVPEPLKNEFTPEAEPSSEEEVLAWHKRVSSENMTTGDLICFLGGGLYDHYVPSTVIPLMSRSEFLTSYTPYQAEINQGTLQSMFEFQSMIGELTQLPVTNASMYDGATAFAEAVLMAINTTDRDTVYYSPNLYDAWSGVLETYAKPHGWNLIELPSHNGQAYFPSDWSDDTAAVCMAYPNQYGLKDRVTEWETNRPDDRTVGIVGINPLSLGLLTPPGDLGWDVAVGEGQPLGLPLIGGAPQVGLLSARERFIRRMPGRLVGETEDRNGNRCFVLTLQTREQHIRRERATSNICTNHALLTIGVAVSLATLGPDGIRRRARRNYHKGRELKRAFESVGLEPIAEPIFNEVAVEAGCRDSLNEKLRDQGWMGGFWTGDRYVCAATERRSKDEIIAFAEDVAQHLG